MIAYLIEYVGATPKPVYVPEDFVLTHGSYTLDAWAAKRFKTKEDAEAFMNSPMDCEKHIQCMPYGDPWVAVEHAFNIRCEVCGGDPGFVYYGDHGWCDGCIPF